MSKKIFIDYDNTKLKTISEELFNLFNKNDFNVTLLDNNISIGNKIDLINNNPNSFVLSNKLNNSNNLEIVYPLRSNNTLAKDLYDNLIDLTNVTKYYQLRSPSNTSLDYYEILRNFNDQAILIKYGNDSLNKNIISTIYQVISKYLGNSNIYIVKSGDSLYSIAKKFNTTVDELKKVNNLTSNLLSINQKLIIPSNNIEENIYYVKNGDSLYSIAKKYNTTVDELKKVNNLTSNLLSINQKLIIPNSYQIYIVVKGDSLYSIAKKYNTTVDELKKINNLTSNLLSINQKLKIK